MLKNIKKFKHAMTLGELLVVFVIMGVIATITMVTVKPGEKSLKYVYYRMYNSIATALYNSSIGMSEELRKEIYDTNVTAKETMSSVLASPDMQFPSLPSQLCKMLTEYINTKGDDNCSAADTTLIDVNSPDFSIAPHFIASNGTKVWMGTNQNITASKPYPYYPQSVTTYKSDGTTKIFWMRIAYVFVDLNGEMAPNSPTQKGDRMADIVGFAITEDLEVIPIGVPITDTRYFSARVVFANKAAKDSDNLVTSEPMSYLQAKKLAWGLSDYTKINEEKHSDNPQSVNNLGLTCDSPFYVGYSSTPSVPTLGICTQISKGIDLSSGTHSEIDNQSISSDCTTVNKAGETVIDMDACYLEIKDYY